MTEVELELGAELFRLTVPGQAAGAGSKTAIPVRRKDGSFVLAEGGRLILNYKHDSDLTEPWMEKVEAMAGSKHGGSAPIDGALWLNCTFYERRPSSHFLTDGRLRPDAPAWPSVTKTHDVDKLRRAISDSLTNAKVIADDKRIIGGAPWKLYADEKPYRACAVISLGRMLHQTVEEAEIASPPPPGQESLT